jgi:hypothetical protein
VTDVGGQDVRDVMFFPRFGEVPCRLRFCFDRVHQNYKKRCNEKQNFLHINKIKFFGGLWQEIYRLKIFG